MIDAGDPLLEALHIIDKAAYNMFLERCKFETPELAHRTAILAHERARSRIMGELVKREALKIPPPIVIHIDKSS